MSIRISWATAGTVVALGAAALPAAAAPASLVPHRAVYDLALADDRSQVADQGAMTGRMVFEFTGAACEGYTVNFRFVVETRDEAGRTTVTDLRTSSFEAGAGDSFQFLSQTYTNQVLTEEVKGTADRASGAMKVKLVSPKAADLSFKTSPIFPTDHLRRIIEAAEKGDRILSEQVFDGSESGDKIYRTTAVIGPARTAPPGEAEAGKIGSIKRWPVSVAYFDSAGTGDQTPDYAISFDLWENGVSTNLTMDYGDFALTGRLKNYEVLPQTACK